MSKLADKLKQIEQLHRNKIDLVLGRTEKLLSKLGNPQFKTPPIIHVAGTNGKGSTIALMRAMLEAAGLRVHAYTSPHLIRFHERIYLAGELVSDEALLSVLEEIETVNAGESITFFEITTVAAFVLFSRTPADVLLLEVGMGGRLDSTNVMTPALTVITRISMDHMEFLGETIEQIAGEKAGIMKPGVPCVLAYQADEAVNNLFRARATELSAPLYECGRDFATEELPDGFMYQAQEKTKFPLPALLGAHQILNAATAITAVKLFTDITDEQISRGLRNVQWPGRLEHITAGPIATALPDNFELWYDGAHNDSGAEALAEQCRRWRGQGYEIHLVIGMLTTKDPAVFKPVLEQAKTVATVPVSEGSSSYSAQDLAYRITGLTPVPVYVASPMQAAVQHIMQTGPHVARQLILVCGSLHLAHAF